MAMIDYLEKDKEKLIDGLTQAGTPEKAGRLVEEELDRLLARYNEQCESERGRESSAYMLQTARAAVPMIGTSGEPKVWEYSAGGTAGTAPVKAPVPVKSRILLIAGLICAVISVVLPLGVSSLLHIASLPASIIFLACSLLAAYGAGITRRAPEGNVQAQRKQMVEVPVDAGKIYRCLRAIILSVDQTLNDIHLSEEWDKTHGSPSALPGGSGEPDGAELAMLSDLLEAAYSGDGEFALEKLSGIRYYLYKKQIEVIDYSKDTAGMFDIMPAKGKASTMRPALVYQGRLLRKGIATEGAD